MREWRDFEYSRTKMRTPILETLDAMIARAEQELDVGSNNEHEINFRGR